MKKGNENYEILCNCETNTFQYESNCAEDGNIIDHWTSDYSHSELDQHTSDVNFNELNNSNAFEQAMTDISCDAADFFDLE